VSEIGPDLAAVPHKELVGMLQAAGEIQSCVDKLRREKSSVLKNILSGQRTVTVLQPYPQESVTDATSGSQYYFHSHGHRGDEVGHFHTFVYESQFDGEVRVVNDRPTNDKSGSSPRYAHLVAIAVSAESKVVRLFTTNQWVTQETFFSDGTVGKLVDKFSVSDEESNGQPILNCWVNSTLRFYRPQILWLIAQRENRIKLWQQKHPDASVFEEKELEELSSLDVDFETHRKNIEQKLAAFHRK